MTPFDDRNTDPDITPKNGTDFQPVDSNRSEKSLNNPLPLISEFGCKTESPESADVRVRRLPPWLKKRLPAGGAVESTANLLSKLNLTTVCDGAHCPNRAECFQCRTATFMILGERCTRNCRFCAIEPVVCPDLPDPNEPQRVAEAVNVLGLKHVVVTSVTRDDLPDGGADHFARTIRAIKRIRPESTVEVLTPDFKGNRSALECVLEAGCEVFNHNVETIPRLYLDVRPQADFEQSLTVLSNAADWFEKQGFSGSPAGTLKGNLQDKLLGNRSELRYTKSGFMVGLGETDDEVINLLKRLKQARVDIVTIGQYLAPSREHFPVQRYVAPETFAQWETAGRELGFRAIFAGPFVRSSYHAGLIMEQAEKTA